MKDKKIKEIQDIQMILVKEARKRGYSARSLALEVDVNIGCMQKYFAHKLLYPKITNILIKHFDCQIKASFDVQDS